MRMKDGFVRLGNGVNMMAFEMLDSVEHMYRVYKLWKS